MGLSAPGAQMQTVPAPGEKLESETLKVSPGPLRMWVNASLAASHFCL